MQKAKMELGGAGPAQLGTKDKKPFDRPQVQVVSNEHASMRPGKQDPLKGCCGASELKVKGK